MSGAKCGADVEVGVDSKTLDVLKQGIEELRRQPDRWEETMLATVKQLEESSNKVAKQVAQEVRSTYNSIAGQTGSEFSCRSDFVVIRLEQRLQKIGHKLDKARFPAPDIFPVICSTNPSDSITLATNLLVFYGFDFQEEFNQPDKPFNAYLQYADGTGKQAVGFVAIPHNYQLVVDLQSPELKQVIRAMNPNKGPQIVLEWGGRNVGVNPDKQRNNQAALPIILPAPEPPKPPKRDYVAVGKIGPFGGPYGDWTTEERCPTGQWVLGASLKIEPEQKTGDDTALNGIYLLCGTVEDKGSVTEISSGTGGWGDKINVGNCGDKYVTGVQLRIEGPQGSGDDTGAVDAEFLCQDGKRFASARLGWGGWSSLKTCPPASAICGIKTKVEPSQGKGDDTALNDAEFTCCSLP